MSAHHCAWLFLWVLAFELGPLHLLGKHLPTERSLPLLFQSFWTKIVSINLVYHANILAFTQFIPRLTQLSLFYSSNSLSLCRLNNSPKPWLFSPRAFQSWHQENHFLHRTTMLRMLQISSVFSETNLAVFSSNKMAHALLSNDVKIYSKRIDNLSAQRGLWKPWLWQKRIHEIKRPPQNLHSQNKHLLSVFSVLSMFSHEGFSSGRKKYMERDDFCFPGEVLYPTVFTHWAISPTPTLKLQKNMSDATSAFH